MNIKGRGFLHANLRSQLLGSAYLLGGESEYLDNIYANESKELEPWKDSPGEVSTYDWRDYLGDRRYDTQYQGCINLSAEEPLGIRGPTLIFLKTSLFLMAMTGEKSWTSTFSRAKSLLSTV